MLMASLLCEAKSLMKDNKEKSISGDFSYSSDVGMLLYLAGHADITLHISSIALLNVMSKGIA